ncbi:MAG TPA: LptA/OstA family protein [Xanthobacteraceae bacterium]|nr:LptA/OstA family protein [Xanthobacteraceae bacterium]
MTRRIGHLGHVAAVLAAVMAAGWAAAAQTTPAARGAPAQGGQGVASPLAGFSQNGDQPIKIDSTSLEVRDKDHIATFIGNVHVVQGDTTMTCKTLVVFYDQSATTPAAAPKGGQTGSGSGGQQIKRLEAKGGVVITQKDQTATGDNGVFDMKTNTAILTGNVVVTQGDNVVRGDRLVVDMTTGISRVEADKSSKSGVKALFKPNSPPNGQPGAAPGPGPAKEAKPSAPMKIN